MKPLTMTAKGRELTMHFDNKAWLVIEEEFGSLEAMYELLDGKDKPLYHTVRMTAVIANAGERKAGRPADITPEWLTENLSPKQLRKANTMAKAAIMEGWKREAEEDDDVPVDVELEAIQKKTASD